MKLIFDDILIVTILTAKLKVLCYNSNNKTNRIFGEAG